MTLKTVNSIKGKRAYIHKYMSSRYTDNLYSAYKTGYSSLKEKAMQDCKSLQKEMHGVAGKICTANGWKFTYGFVCRYNGWVSLVYITDCCNYLIPLYEG